MPFLVLLVLSSLQNSIRIDMLCNEMRLLNAVMFEKLPERTRHKENELKVAHQLHLEHEGEETDVWSFALLAFTSDKEKLTQMLYMKYNRGHYSCQHLCLIKHTVQEDTLLITPLSLWNVEIVH